MAESEKPSRAPTLPDPELNPLMNPLLAANMGRWAEVYFTSPPERRQEAVAALIRELGGKSPFEPATQVGAIPRDESQQPDDAQLPNSMLRDSSERRDSSEHRDLSERSEHEDGPPRQEDRSPVICDSCGYISPAGNRFCGMCGSELENGSQDQAFQFADDSPQIADPAWRQPEANASSSCDAEESGSPETTLEAETVEHRAIAQFATAAKNEDSVSHFKTLFAAAPPAPADEQFKQVFADEETPPVHRSYRIYAGTLVAVLIAILAYLTWRSTSAFKGSPLTYAAKATEASALSSPAPRQAETGATEPAKAVAPTQPDGSGEAAVGTSRNPAAPLNRNRSEEHSMKNAKSNGAPVHASLVVNQNGGAEELKKAETYLKGAEGRTHNSAEAAAWLWKAVAKENVTATATLADLYLRGDGVAKNCDQARVLLQSAARKGSVAAAERLRNLQSFACQ